MADVNGHGTGNTDALSWGGASSPIPPPRTYYHMRGWHETWGSYETWTSKDEPDLTPPSGGPVTNITVIRWEY